TDDQLFGLRVVEPAHSRVQGVQLCLHEVDVRLDGAQRGEDAGVVGRLLRIELVSGDLDGTLLYLVEGHELDVQLVDGSQATFLLDDAGDRLDLGLDVPVGYGTTTVRWVRRQDALQEHRVQAFVRLLGRLAVGRLVITATGIGRLGWLTGLGLPLRVV